MPKKNKAEESNQKVEAPPPAADEEEDSPAVKALKVIDDKYCAIEIEFEREAEKLRKKFKADNAHLLAERSKVLQDASNASDADKALATPACKGFWLQALQNCEEFSEVLQEWDEPVLEFLEDIKSSDMDPDHEKKGTLLEFSFKENPYFTNKTLTIEVIYDYDPESHKPWMQLQCKEIKSSPIEWNAGKDVTVELTQKKVKGGGAKKKKAAGKAKEEPRPSFFRSPFCNLKAGEPFPEALAFMIDNDEVDDDDNDEIVKMFLCQISEMCETIDEGVTKYAVRFYTGEAQPDGDDDDFSEDGEEESGDDDDEDDDDSEDEAPARPKGKGKAKAKAGGAAGGKQEECKQQ